MSHFPRVVYIIGEGRSGTTLLGDLLGLVGGFFHAGEIDHLWTELRKTGSVIPCSCGKTVTECPVWSEVIARLHFPDARTSEEITRWPRDVGRLPRIRTLLSGPRVLARNPDAGAYADLLARTYATIASVTSARVIVDSTKHPAEGLLACSHPDVEAFAVHLVRDPRAVLHSRIRLATWSTDKPATDRTVAYAVARWNARNWLAESITRRCAQDRSMRIRYEDLVSDPASTVAEILSALGEPRSSMPTIRRNTVEFTPGHTLAGNLTKFRSGQVELAEDGRWRDALTATQRLAGTLLSLPLLPIYGYPLRVKRSRFAASS